MNKEETEYEKVIRKVKNLRDMAYEIWVHVNHLPHNKIIDEIGTTCDIVLKYLQSNEVKNNDKDIL